MIVFFVFVLETRSGKEIDVKCEVHLYQKTNRYLVLVQVQVVTRNSKLNTCIEVI